MFKPTPFIALCLLAVCLLAPCEALWSQLPASRRAGVAAKMGEAGEAVNLGLSVQWSDRNMGAERPEQVGRYFGYGDVSGEDVTQASGDYQTQDVTGSDYDPAHVFWRDGWRMPTTSEIQELLQRCFWRWTKQNGVEGYVVTGRAGKSIFLPATGHIMDSQLYYGNSRGYYWSGMVSQRSEGYAQTLFFYKGNKMIKDYRNFYGFCIRPVKD